MVTMVRTHCRNGHLLTEDKVKIETSPRTGAPIYRCLTCVADRRKRSGAVANAKRRAERAERRDAGLAVRTQDGGIFVRYEYDWWTVGSTLFMKVSAIEYERAEYDDFRRQARRKIVQLLERHDINPSIAKGAEALVEWDRSRNWADSLTESITFQMARPLPRALEEDDASAA